MNTLLARPALEDHPFVAGAPGRFLRELAPFTDEVRFKAGDMLLEQRHYADKLYLITEGIVSVSYQPESPGASIELQTLGPGEVAGWSWLFPPFCSHFAVRALSAGRAVRINGPSLLVHAEEHPEFGYMLIRRVAKVLIQRLNALAELVAEQRGALSDGAAHGGSEGSRVHKNKE